MNKELEAFERVKESLLHAVGGNGYPHYINYANSAEPAEEDLDTIETALKKAEAIDKCHLVAIPRMSNKTSIADECVFLQTVLKIIIIKEVNVQNFKNACATMSYEQYLFMWKDGCFMGIRLTSKIMLTQEEYDLLKEVLL